MDTGKRFADKSCLLRSGSVLSWWTPCPQRCPEVTTDSGQGLRKNLPSSLGRDIRSTCRTPCTNTWRPGQKTGVLSTVGPCSQCTPASLLGLEGILASYQVEVGPPWPGPSSRTQVMSSQSKVPIDPRMVTASLSACPVPNLLHTGPRIREDHCLPPDFRIPSTGIQDIKAIQVSPEAH